MNIRRLWKPTKVQFREAEDDPAAVADDRTAVADDLTAVADDPTEISGEASGLTATTIQHQRHLSLFI